MCLAIGLLKEWQGTLILGPIYGKENATKISVCFKNTKKYNFWVQLNFICLFKTFKDGIFWDNFTFTLHFGQLLINVSIHYHLQCSAVKFEALYSTGMVSSFELGEIGDT